MAPKKQSGFMIFVNKFRTKPTGQRMSLPQAVHHCGELWAKMTDQQRGPYISEAKNANVQSRSNYGALNCHGNLITTIEKEEQSLANETVRMKRDIERIVRKGKSENDLENAKFVFVSFNYFVKGLNTEIYIPAEFSACEFSLKGGVNSLYSSLINPGQLIFGQACDAMLHTTSTHMLPLPPSALGEPNMGKLYQSIQDYLRSRLDQEVDDLQDLKVFTTPEQMPVVKSCFRFIETGCEDVNNSDDDDDNNNSFYGAAAQRENNFLPIAVYDIQYLFYVMKKETLSVAGLPEENFNTFITDAFFLRDFYEYQDGIACWYHEEKDRGKYCTQSRVNRWAYTFCDYMCGDLAIMMQPGKHMPPSYKTSNSLSKIKSNTIAESYFSLGTSESNVNFNQESEEKPLEETISLASSLASLHTYSTAKSKRLTQTEESETQSVEHRVIRGNRNAWNLQNVSRTIDEFTDEEFSMSSVSRNRRGVSAFCQKKTAKKT